MLIKLFRKGYQIQIIIIVLLSGLLWSNGFITPPDIIPANDITPLYNIFTFIKSPLLNTIIAYLFMLTQAFMLSSITGKHKILNLTNLFPALIYVVLMSYNSNYLTLSPALLSNFIIILFFRVLLDIYNTKEPFFLQFRASTMAGIAFLISPANIILIVIIWGAYFIFRNSTLREWIISLLGFFMIMFFFASYIYLSDSETMYLTAYKNYFSSIKLQIHISNTYLIPFFATTALISLIAISKILSTLQENIINTRKKLSVTIFYSIIIFITIFTSLQTIELQIFQLFITLSIIISILLLSVKKQRYKELIFSLILITVILEKILQYA